jgi:hypothetical protein
MELEKKIKGIAYRPCFDTSKIVPGSALTLRTDEGQKINAIVTQSSTLEITYSYFSVDSMGMKEDTLFLEDYLNQQGKYDFPQIDPEPMEKIGNRENSRNDAPPPIEEAPTQSSLSTAEVDQILKAEKKEGEMKAVCVDTQGLDRNLTLNKVYEVLSAGAEVIKIIDDNGNEMEAFADQFKM